MSDFLTEVLPVVRRVAGLRCHKALHPDVETEAWFVWQAKPDASPGAIAWYALKKVYGGQQTGFWSKKRDALTGAWRCGLLEEATDPKGRKPETIASLREHLRRIKEVATEGEKEMIDLCEQEWLPNKEIAQRLGVSPGRISQRRRELLNKVRD